MKNQSISMQKKYLKTLGLLGLALMFGLLSNTLYAQNTDRTVKGVVTSLDGPLLGATIVLKGTTLGVTSAENGAFTFPKKLKENDVLVVSYLGYKTREVTINRVTSFIEPFLEDIPVLIHGALRTSETIATEDSKRDQYRF